MKLRTLHTILVAAFSFVAQQASAELNVYATPYKIVGNQSGLCLTGYPAIGLPAPVSRGLKFKLQPCADDVNSRSMQTFYVFRNWSTSSVNPQDSGQQEVQIFWAKQFELTGQWRKLQAERAWGAPIYMGGDIQTSNPNGTWFINRASHGYSPFDVTIKHYPTGYCISPAYHSTAPGTDIGVGMCAVPGDVWRLVPTNYATSPL
jgi:hypothetical protein